MKKVFIIHGFGGIPNGSWISWLMTELGKKDVYACSLPMPNPKNPIVSEWTDEINHAVNNCLKDDEIFLIGHSLGVPAILRYFEQSKQNKKISGVILVSGLIDPLDSKNKKSNFRKIDSFVFPFIDFRKIKNKAKKFVVFHSVDDPIVPFYHAEKISKELNCKLVKTKKGGHFFILSKPICYKIPKLLKEIESILN